jgi:energy-coupling factor transporter ATP-binding protein EcfA2
MAIIESVKINGFWGNHTISMDFDHEVNFLVGINGSGKTTAINILASALQCDEDALERLPFSSIEITLFDRKTRRKPSITVERVRMDGLRYPFLRYKIKEFATASNEETKVFSPFEISDQELTHGRGSGPWWRTGLKNGYLNKDARAEIAKLIKMNWLSINRVSTVSNSYENPANETHVDIKLREISDRLERYFSELSSNAGKRTREFQKKFFRSLIDVKEGRSLNFKLDGMDLMREKSALIDIFNRFGIPENEYWDDTNSFFELLKFIQREKTNKFSINELLAVTNAQKIHSLVDAWNASVEEENEILTPRDAFVNILDTMLHRKVTEVLPSGEMVFHTNSGKILRISDLSSGEKQLFIILGEALLQKDAEWTYIADEPELSLHVDWQEVLVDNLRALNPNSQVIFATHSPDIISHYSENVIDMEKVIE